LSLLTILQHHSARRWLRYSWLAALLSTAVVSLLPASRLVNLQGSDKVWHGGWYMLLALPVCFIFPPTRQSLTATGALAIYGALIEAAQMLVPGRSCEWGDMLANSTGAAFGFLLSRIALRIATSGPSAGLTATRRP